MQAALRHRRKHDSPEHQIAEDSATPGAGIRDAVARLGFASGTGPLDEDGAATVLQYAAARAFIGRNISFQREKLLQRIQLELELMRGLRLLFWCMCMFAIVVCESPPPPGALRLAMESWQLAQPASCGMIPVLWPVPPSCELA